MDCGGCGRKIVGEIPRCVYCGWAKDPELRKIAEAGKVQKETFRSGATLWPFVASAIIFTVLAVVAASAIGGQDNPLFIGVLIAGCVFLGPVLCAVQILRRS